MRATLVLLLAACYRPTLGEAPFACERGGCPQGYRCASGLCVTLSSPDPPQLLTVVGGRAQPQPLWLSGRSFAIGWTQDTDSELGAPGLFRQLISPDGLGERSRTPAMGDDLDFAVIHPPGGSSVVAAVRTNTNGTAALNVYIQRVEDVLSGSPALEQVPLRTVVSVPEGYGFSTPSLSAPSQTQVMVGVAFTSPPAIVSDNAFCATIDTLTSAVDRACSPDAGVTFASEVAIAANARGWVLFWRDRLVHATGVFDGLALGHRDTDAEQLLNPVLRDGQVAAVVRARNDAGGRIWGLAFTDVMATSPSFEPTLTRAGVIVPHLIAAGAGYLGCDLDEQGELQVTSLSGTDLAELSARKVQRVSKAIIESCRIALAEDGTVAVAWKERVAGRSDVFRVYAALLLP